jgi:N-acetylglucosaminyldiphosphoundecaprenol N-acetyl-beta-D-mannosaminyltransferase
MNERYRVDEPNAGKDWLLGSPRVPVAGIPIMASPAHDVITHLQRVANDLRGSGIPVHFVNAYTVSLTEDETYLKVFQSSSLNFADGTPLAWLARRKSAQVAHMRGPDAFRAILNSAPEFGLRHFLLGGTADSLSRLETVISQDFPNARIAGSFSPPFHDLTQSDHQQIDAMLEDADANVIWVGIGTPKQDYEVARIAARHPAVVLAVGAAFNFVSGDVVEAPAFWRRTGLEWMYRFGREPRRLWRRYVFGNLRFLLLAARRRSA